MNEILRLGFAGLGEAATRVLPEIVRLPHVKVTAAADARPNALETFRDEFGGATYRSVEEMVRAPL